MAAGEETVPSLQFKLKVVEQRVLELVAEESVVTDIDRGKFVEPAQGSH